MPQRLASEIAKLISTCRSDEDVRETAVHALRTSSQYGFDHRCSGFTQAVCDGLQARARDERDSVLKHRLLTAVETVCALADELSREALQPT